MRNRICILGIVMLLFAGCYDDKGNYDYRDINDVLSIVFSPSPDQVTEDSVYTYTYPQASVDTMYVTYTPSVTQSQAVDESMLEYQWIFATGQGYDTVFSKELTLGYPFQKILTYSPLFRLIDHSTGVEYYRSFQMNTREPYLNSWYVLHGRQGDRRLGVAEISESGEVSVTEDAYETAFGVRRFQNATGMFYSPRNEGAASVMGGDNEYLMVYERDSCTQLSPFVLVERRDYRSMLPDGDRTFPIVAGIDEEMGDGNMSSSMILILENGKCYWSRGTHGYFFSMKAADDAVDYHADQAFIPLGLDDVPNPYAIIWDDVHKTFYYYSIPSDPLIRDELNAHPADDAYDEGCFVRATQTEGVFEEGELANMEVLSMIFHSEDGHCGVIFHNTSTDEYFYYKVGFTAEKGGAPTFGVERTPLQGLGINEESQFAASYAFNNQFFYTVGGDLYLFNIGTGDSRLLYATTGTIVKLKFAVSREYYEFMYQEGYNYRLGVAVETLDGQGEIHDLRLANSGDVDASYICPGFGPIADVIFSVHSVR